jgi:hypothetical protein
MNCLHLIWPYVAKALEATYFAIEIALIGAFIAWLQLRYAKKRDATLDARNQWEKTHRAMMEFRFRQELLDTPLGLSNEDMVQAAHARYMLRGELDRAPNSPLVKQIVDLLDANVEIEKWRAAAFTGEFDKFVQQVALKSR